MKHFVAFIRSTPISAHISAICVTLLWMLKALWLDHVRAPINWFFDLSKIAEGFLAAYIAGYVFYVFFALMPDYVSRVRLGSTLFSKIARIGGDCSAVLLEIQKASGHALAFNSVSQVDLENAFLATPTSYRPAMIFHGNQASIFDFFADRQSRTLETISQLFEQSRFLDADLIRLLDQIRGNSFFTMTRPTGYPISNSDLGAWAGAFFRYLESCRQLRDWHNDHRVPSISLLRLGPFVG